jgi:hypothetical protein
MRVKNDDKVASMSFIAKSEEGVNSSEETETEETQTALV